MLNKACFCTLMFAIHVLMPMHGEGHMKTAVGHLMTTEGYIMITEGHVYERNHPVTRKSLIHSLCYTSLYS